MRSTFRSIAAQITILALVLMTSPVSAMDSTGGATLEGLLVDVDGTPAAGYRVHLIDDEGTPMAQATAGEDGLYSFSGVPAGEYAMGIENTGGQMAPTTLIDQKTETSPLGRSAVNEGFPIRACELINTLDAPYYIERVSVTTPGKIRKAKKAIHKAFQYQREGRGYTFVEVVSTCPTNWGMNSPDSMKWAADNMEPIFPLGVFRDQGAEQK